MGVKALYTTLAAIILAVFMACPAQAAWFGPDSSGLSGLEALAKRKPSKGPEELHNIVKFNPLLILLGEMPLYYEKQIAQKVSLEVGIGPTVKAPLQSLDNNAADNYGRGAFEYTTGFTFKAMLRYYPGLVHFPEGIFFGPEIRYKQYNAEYNYTSLNTNREVNLVFRRKYLDYVLTFGDQVSIADNVFAEAYLGVGVRSKNVPSLKDYYPPGTGTSQELYVVNKTSSVVLLSLGFKVGFAF